MIRLKLKRNLPPKLEPNLAPLVDVIFLLLIFFIVGSSLSQHNVIKINLPKSAKQEKTIGEKTTISIDQQQNVYLNGVLINKEDLQENLENLTEKEKVILAADKNISYNTIIEIINIATSSGIKFLSLDTKK